MSTSLSVSSAVSSLAAQAGSATTLDANADSDPVAFLAALIDQLTGASGDAPADPTGTPVDPLAAALTQMAAAQASETPPVTQPDLTALLDKLAAALKTLKDAKQSGDAPDADTLKSLSDTLDALLALIVPQVQTQSTLPTPPSDDQPNLLGAIGDTSSAPASLSDLSQQLADLAKDLQAASPAVADKLKALDTTLKGMAADPSAFAGLLDGTDLDSLIKKLLGADGGTTTATPAARGATSATPLAAAPELAAPQPLATTASTAVTAVDANPKDDHARAGGLKPSDASPLAQFAVHVAQAAEPHQHGAADTGVAALAQAQTNVPAAAPAARLLPAAYQNAAPVLNMGQVAFEIAHQMQKGQSRFTIRLDPPELGRVDVRMSVDHTGAVNARLTVEKPETLDMFQRDKTTLERALAQAGVDGSKTNLEFSLRQNPFPGNPGGQSRDGRQPGTFPRFSAEDDDTVASSPAITLYRGAVSTGGVNLFV